MRMICIGPKSSLREAIACINRHEAQIALVVDDEDRLVDTVTDGDIRRAILSGMDLDAPVKTLRSRRTRSPYPQPVTAHKDTEPSDLLRLMEERCVRQVPLLDDEQRVVGLSTLRELLKSDSLPLQAVVMAGGYGSRLRPLTEDVPKTMLRVGDRPLLESIVEQLRESGIKRLHLATHYKGDVIARHFGDGRDFGVEIQYVEEDKPLGTAGALCLLGSTEDPVLVVNGDILTRVDFRAMLEFHTDHAADMTVAVRRYESQIPYGVIDSDGVNVLRVAEKPYVSHFINAGIYLLDPKVCQCIPNGQSYDMTELINKLVADGRRVISFPVHEYWLDIGRIEEYQKAQQEYHQVFKK